METKSTELMQLLAWEIKCNFIETFLKEWAQNGHTSIEYENLMAQMGVDSNLLSIIDDETAVAEFQEQAADACKQLDGASEIHYSVAIHSEHDDSIFILSTYETDLDDMLGMVIHQAFCTPSEVN
jgi:hypothetical protein